jgi:hypothetical protein
VSAATIPEGLRRAYILVLAPLAMAAPIPLFWTEGALPAAVLLYECSVLLILWRARAGHPVRLSDTILNAIGLSYFVWLGFEVSVLHHGLLRSVSHLLLFTGIAKLASLKRPGEARTALLVLFLLTLASASSSTHVTSLLYFVLIAVIGFRTLGRMAVLADFEDAPPDRVLTAVPTSGLAAAAIAGAIFVTVPLFYSLPRLRSPFAVAPFRVDDALATALAADRVDLESFGAAKKSDRVVLRLDARPERLLGRVLRLREAVFTDYRSGVWTRNAYGRGSLRSRGDFGIPALRPGERFDGRVSIDLNLPINGFLFLPYGTTALELDRGFPAALPDGVVQVAARRRAVQYTVGVREQRQPRGAGVSAIDPAIVPPEIRDYAAKLTGDLTDPLAIYSRIHEHLQQKFVYTLDPPPAAGDPIVQFLTRSRAGHCEFFASAAAMMLASRGIPARLVTGSYGGEIGLLSRSIVVRAGNLHAWVEADLDGRGFMVLDPTPPSGIPEATSRVSVWSRLGAVAREVEFFYDRRILGFDALDQAQAFDQARQSFGRAAEEVGSWGRLLRGRGDARTGAAAVVGIAALAAAVLLARRGARRRARGPAKSAYLTLRHLLARRVGALSAALPPARVADLYARTVPAAAGEARAVVDLYCRSEFGGEAVSGEEAAKLRETVRRLRKLA